MGRELGIYRIDFLNDNTAIIRHSNYNLCGRTDFTHDISNLFLFYGQDTFVNYLIIKPDTEKNYSSDELKTIHVAVEDDFWDEKEFDLTYGFVHRSTIQEIVDENRQNDELELKRDYRILSDARFARRRSVNIDVFNDFSDLIDEVTEHINNFYSEANSYITEIEKLEQTLNKGDNSSSDPSIVESGILLTYSE